MKSKPKVELDDSLKQFLASAKPDDALQVVFRLKPCNPGEIVPDPKSTVEIAQTLLDRVRQSTGVEEHDHNVFDQLGYFVVDAPKVFVTKLLEQPEIAAATTSPSSQSAFIRPVKVKKVRIF
jgi:hypothetical protein